MKLGESLNLSYLYSANRGMVVAAPQKSQIADEELTADRISKIEPKKIRNISNDQLQQISTEAIKNLTKPQISQLSTDQIVALNRRSISIFEYGSDC